MNNNRPRIDDYALTSADKQAWWEYIQYYQPRYYRGALFYYSGEHDPRLEPDYVPQDMDINDYLAVFCGLPRIKTDHFRNTITVDGVDIKTYLPNNQWYQKRLFFARLKKTYAFKQWKLEQYNCQQGKCVWCEQHIEPHSPETHVDHVLPLLWYGTNEFNNLVLSCANCNMEKAASTTGYNGKKGAPGENKVPDWVKTNRYAEYYDSNPIIVSRQVDEIPIEDVEIFPKKAH